MMINAEIIADSLNEFGDRITTYVLTFPRIVLAEFNTHRMLSKNSASSRAIPFEKMLELVQDSPFIPIKWMKEHKGMQGLYYFDDAFDVLEFNAQWLYARDSAIEQARILSKAGITKQICNRLLEPFMYHRVICTGTEWDNFFALRAHPDAEIHIQDLAYKMLVAYNKSEPKLLKAGEWHIPFGDKFDNERMWKVSNGDVLMPENADLTKERLAIATARCARISYNNFEGKDDYANDINLHDRLLDSGHMSPFEHCARVMAEGERGSISDSRHIGGDEYGHELREFGWCGNFKGFIQYRKTIKGENKIDPRVAKRS